MSSKAIILLVDDEPEVLSAIERDLRPQYRRRWGLMKAGSGAKALEILETLKQRENTVALIVSDQRMPEMGGAEFLARSRDLFPLARKVLLTAYADTEAAIQSINQAKIDHYLVKPWDPPEEKLFPVLDELLADWRSEVPYSYYEDYLLGSDDVELRRLEEQHGVWNPHVEALLDAAAYHSGESVLDLGAGPGFASISLAERVGAEGRVLAVDTSDRFVDHIRQLIQHMGLNQIEYRVADVGTLSVDGDLYDGALARWLFCFLDDPEGVVRQTAGLLKPGARLSIIDYFSLPAAGWHPRSPALDKAFPAICNGFAASGGDLDVGDKLPAMLERNDFDVTHLHLINEISRPGEPHWNWIKSFRGSFFPKLVAGGFLGADELEDFDQAPRRRQRPAILAPLTKLFSNLRNSADAQPDFACQSLPIELDSARADPDTDSNPAAASAGLPSRRAPI